MKSRFHLGCRLALVLVLGFALTATAATRYVNQSNSTPAFPYTNWATAATRIQDAVNAAAAGEEVVVTNGVHSTGATAVYGMSNRVAVTKAVTVRSVNGPLVTQIVGYQVPGSTNGSAAVRCVYLTNGAVLAGFTLTNGATQASASSTRGMSGGGVWCEGTSAVVSNCVITGNSGYRGGGASGGTLYNCALTGNSASTLGGGASFTTLINCTLTGNSAYYGGGAENCTLRYCSLTGNSASSNGGGAYSGTLNNCSLTGNSAYYGGGACRGTLNNCSLTGNSAYYGGGACQGPLNNCTLTGNSAFDSGGGAYGARLLNCIIYYNASLDGSNTSESPLNYCCTTPLPSSGTGNIDSEPQLASASHLSAASPCRGAGSSAYAIGLDIDGEPWANPASIGCDEYWSGAVTGALTAEIVVDYPKAAVGFSPNFQALISGRTTASVWNFGDGVVVSNRPYTTHAWAAAGDYTVVLRAYNEAYPLGVAASVTVHVIEQPVHYVSLSSVTPVVPYNTWTTAATNIQAAVDAADTGGALVLVSNGVYQAGARAVYGTSNRVAVTKAVIVRSVNGPLATQIVGYQVPGMTNGPAAVRCAYLTNGAMLAGFTLTNGATQVSGDNYQNQSGGGVWCEGTSAVLANCVIAGNSASYAGGGAYYGTLTNCTLTGNSAQFGGAAFQGTLNNCTLTGNSAGYGGGGAYYGTLIGCTLTGNSATNYGGGAYYGSLNNCTLTSNAACGGGGSYSATLNNCILMGNSAGYGGGAYDGQLNNCTITANSAYYFGGGAFDGTLKNCTLTANSAYHVGGGACGAGLYNCIVYYNAAPNGNYSSDCTLYYCCTTPLPDSGTDNIDSEPQLASSSHLSITSPCRGAGSGAYATGLDIDGEPWASPPSIGCDEYWSGSVTGALTARILVDYTNVAAGFSLSFQALVSGKVTTCSWDFGDGMVVSNRPCPTHAWVVSGDYVVQLLAYNETHPQGISASVTIHVTEQPVHYVTLSSLAPIAPYGTWATAATNIQDAVDASSVPGALILVSNGVYQTGAQAVDGRSNRLAVTKAVTVRSVNGPLVTQIVGYQVPGVTNGPAAVRCVYLTGGALLAGFTLTNGGTQTPGDYYQNRSAGGGGVWCEGAGAVVSNCVITGNSAYYLGGGVCGGTVKSCTLTSNLAASYGGGASFGALDNCMLTSNSAYYGGGGAYQCTLTNCTLTSNSSVSSGGGAGAATLNNCTLMYNWAGSGGGADGCTLNNCMLTGNSASEGGGASFGTLKNWMLTGNSVSSRGGGVYYSTLNDCTLTSNSASSYGGGGASDSGLNNCTLTGNSAYSGGGAQGCTLNNCTLVGNSASGEGGGAVDSTLNNCTITGNSAYSGGGSYMGTLNNCTITGNSGSYCGGAAYAAELRNCVVYYNTGTNANYTIDCTLNYCCTTPLPPGTGNFTNAPLFADTNAWADLRLQSNSPCINSGCNAFAPSGPDMDGNPRIVGGTVDVGVYEFQSPTSLLSYAWLQQFGWPIDGSADYADPDHDGMSNWQEWNAGTDPTSAASALQMSLVWNAPSGITLTWSSVTNRTYSLERAPTLSAQPAFGLVCRNITGLNGFTSFTDTNAIGAGPFFYRVRVEQR